jgi:hypothetical protein
MYVPARECTCPPGNTGGNPTVGGGLAKNPALYSLAGMYIPWRACTFPGGHVHSLAGIISGGKRLYRISREAHPVCADRDSRQCSAMHALNLNTFRSKSKIHSCPPGNVRARQGMYVPARECTCPPGNVRARQGMYVPARECTCPPGNTGGNPTVGGGLAKNPALYSLAGMYIPWRACTFPGGHVHSLAGIISGGKRLYRISREAHPVCADRDSRQCSAMHALNLNTFRSKSKIHSCPPGNVRARQGMYVPARECTCPPGNVRARQGIQGAIRRLGVGWPKIRPCIPWRACTFPGGHNFRRKTLVPDLKRGAQAGRVPSR